MNTCLHNRKNLQKLMSTFMDSAVLEPQLIEDICNKEINEQYVDYIRQLCQKLEYLAKQNISDSSAVRELGKVHIISFLK
jgi:vacuolar protein sorting-associated protein 52